MKKYIWVIVLLVFILLLVKLFIYIKTNSCLMTCYSSCNYVWDEVLCMNTISDFCSDWKNHIIPKEMCIEYKNILSWFK